MKKQYEIKIINGVPTKVEVQPKVEAEKSYKELRLEAYGSVQEQIEFITENGLTKWKDKVKEIKAQFPKPE